MEKNKVFGQKRYGSDEVLSEIDDDLCKTLSWGRQGYTVASFLSDTTWTELRSGFKSMFREVLSSCNIHVPAHFLPEKYHREVLTKEAHLAVIEQTKLFQADRFPIDLAIVEERISELLKFEVKSVKPFNGERVFHFRVIRPGRSDYNPIHRDVWQDENRDAINIYVPLAGSNQKSSLRLIPGSHKWKESDTVRSDHGAKMNELKFNVPGLMSSSKELQLERPNPGENEVLIFSPYLLHGLSDNSNEDLTRISLEMRFWRV